MNCAGPQVTQFKKKNPAILQSCSKWYGDVAANWWLVFVSWGDRERGVGQECFQCTCTLLLYTSFATAILKFNFNQSFTYSCGFPTFCPLLSHLPPPPRHPTQVPIPISLQVNCQVVAAGLSI